jgi:RNA-dependent RNA polymerase
MLSKNEFAGLGFSQEEPNWYGGKVEFRATLQDTSSTDIPQYKIVLQRPVLGTSCRFTRRFGSQSFLRVKIPSALLNKRDHDLVRFLSRPFILTGYVFRAFYAKKDHVFLFKTCEVYDGKNVSEPMVTGRKSDLTFQQFIDWHNPLQFNIRQGSIL